MTSNSLEELRQQLLSDEYVQEMIRARAYEIYHMRGVQPGGPAQDWFQAESEVLAFLLAHQPDHATGTSTTDASPEPIVSKKRKPRSTTKDPSAKKLATRRPGAKKSATSESKSKRLRKESKSEDQLT